MTRGRPAHAVRPSLPVLGVDVGGVLVDRVAEESDTSFFGSEPMATPAVLGSLEALRTLNPLFEGRVHVVSKAGDKISRLTREWLGQHGYLADDIVPSGNVHFVRKRPEKGPVCTRHGITHFIDDRVDVMQHLRDIVGCRYLFTGGLGPHRAPPQIPPDVVVCDSWPRLTGLLLRDVSA